jgi:alkanesulfonate monooxygenase SsuD/methylene tetrahydromethanopterin reductase-like flavin-dependent oxidoreductase (luciferase family)
MRFGVHVPIFGPFGEPEAVVDLAVAAETRGWDGFFLWDHVWFPGSPPTTDPTVLLAAVAQATERIVLGPLVTPLARRRAVKLARETVALDRLSRGRLVLGVGLGVPRDYGLFGEDPDPRRRGDVTDETVAALRRLWSQEPVALAGEHVVVGRDGDEPVAFRPGPYGRAAIPMWGAARVGSPPRPFRRAAALDGVCPVPDRYDARGGVTPEQLRSVVERVGRHRSSLEGYDVAVIGHAGGPGDVAPFEAAGATWFLCDLHPDLGGLAYARDVVAQGPPRDT